MRTMILFVAINLTDIALALRESEMGSLTALFYAIFFVICVIMDCIEFISKLE